MTSAPLQGSRHRCADANRVSILTIKLNDILKGSLHICCWSNNYELQWSFIWSQNLLNVIQSEVFIDVGNVLVQIPIFTSPAENRCLTPRTGRNQTKKMELGGDGTCGFIAGTSRGRRAIWAFGGCEEPSAPTLSVRWLIEQKQLATTQICFGEFKGCILTGLYISVDVRSQSNK